MEDAKATIRMGNEMKELKEAARALMYEEYERAAKKFGESFYSPHEACAVILDGAEKAELDLRHFKMLLEYYWCIDVKRNDMEHQNSRLKEIEETVLNAACELIQVAAMAQKARR